MKFTHSKKISRVLIYRLGSLGDFVVSLPCLHLVRRHFPSQRIALLTNQPVVSKAAPARAILDGSGLIDDYIAYPLGTRNINELRDVRRSIRSFNPDVVIYLVSRPILSLVMRDYLFFQVCGVRRVVGLPLARDQQTSRLTVSGLWEPEAERLARCLAPLGNAQPHLPENWDLHLSAAEIAAADHVLHEQLPSFSGGRPLLGMSLGTKQAVKDWGDDNWKAVLKGLSSPDIGLVLIGADEERLRSSDVARSWSGPVINACGRLTPRQSAALIKRTALFLCHDSGPMHLAAAVGTRCIAVFSKKNRPGEWFPFGSEHKIFYPPAESESINAIKPNSIVDTVRGLIL